MSIKYTAGIKALKRKYVYLTAKLTGNLGAPKGLALCFICKY